MGHGAAARRGKKQDQGSATTAGTPGKRSLTDGLARRRKPQPTNTGLDDQSNPQPAGSPPAGAKVYQANVPAVNTAQSQPDDPFGFQLLQPLSVVDDPSTQASPLLEGEADGAQSCAAEANSCPKEDTLVDPDAMGGVKLYIEYSETDAYKKLDGRLSHTEVGPGLVGPYKFIPRTLNGLLFCYDVEHMARHQVEWVVGPDTADSFAASVDLYLAAANAALPGSHKVMGSMKAGAGTHLPSLFEQRNLQQGRWDPSRPEGQADDVHLGHNGGHEVAAVIHYKDNLERLRYNREAQELSRGVAEKVAKGELSHLEGRDKAVDGRNTAMETTRGQTSAAATATAEAIKPTGMTVEKLTKRAVRKAVNIFAGRRLDGSKASPEEVARLQAVFSDHESSWHRYASRLKGGPGDERVYAAALRELGDSTDVSRAIIMSAGAPNKNITIIAQVGTVVNGVLTLFGLGKVVYATVTAEEGQRWHILAGELTAFAGGVLGGQAGAMGGVFVASLLFEGTAAILACSIIGGLVGGVAGAALMGLAFEGGAQMAGAAMVGMNPSITSDGGLAGIYQREHAAKQPRNFRWHVEDGIRKLDEEIRRLEVRAKNARKGELRKIQLARLGFLRKRAELEKAFLALEERQIDNDGNPTSLAEGGQS